VCDHSQGVYFPPNTGGGVSFFGFYPNKKTKEERERKRKRKSSMVISGPYLNGSFIKKNEL